MTSERKLVALAMVLVGFLLAARTGESAPEAVSSPAASVTAGDALAGKQAFSTYCSICHGAAARGFIGPYIAGINWTTPGLHAIVRGGVGGYGSMPAFNADAVTDKNIADIAAYLALLPPETPPQPGPTATPTTSPSPSPSSTSHAAVATSAPGTSLPGDAIRGRDIYAANCAACHGASAQGGVGPNLHGERARKDTAAAIAWIKHPQLPMPTLYPNPLSEKDVEDVAAFVESL